MHNVQDDYSQFPDEETALLAPERKALKTQTPLPRLQISILLIISLAEPITSNCIYPFINQVCTSIRMLSCYTLNVNRQLVSELDITGGDETKVGYYAGLIVRTASYFLFSAFSNNLSGVSVFHDGGHVHHAVVPSVRPDWS